MAGRGWHRRLARQYPAYTRASRWRRARPDAVKNRLSWHRCGQVHVTRGPVRQVAPLCPGRQGLRCAARCARPCRAALDCRAPLRWVATKGCAGRATLPGAGPFAIMGRGALLARTSAGRASLPPAVLVTRTGRTWTHPPGSARVGGRVGHLPMASRVRAGSSNVLTVQKPCSSTPSDSHRVHIDAGRPQKVEL